MKVTVFPTCADGFPPVSFYNQADAWRFANTRSPNCYGHGIGILITPHSDFWYAWRQIVRISNERSDQRGT